MAATKSAPKAPPAPKAPVAPPAPPVAVVPPAPVAAPIGEVDNVELTSAEVADVAEVATRPRHQADIKAFDFDEEMVEPERVVTERESKWVAVLDRLYTATEEGAVKRNPDVTDAEGYVTTGDLKFTKIAHYINPNGARSQVLVFRRDDEINATYEFKPLGSAKMLEGETRPGSDIWARVRETPLEVPAAE